MCKVSFRVLSFSIIERHRQLCQPKKSRSFWLRKQTHFRIICGISPCFLFTWFRSIFFLDFSLVRYTNSLFHSTGSTQTKIFTVFRLHTDLIFSFLCLFLSWCYSWNDEVGNRKMERKYNFRWNCTQIADNM